MDPECSEIKKWFSVIPSLSFYAELEGTELSFNDQDMMLRPWPDISPRLACASELPRVFIKMQIPGSHARSSESECLEVDPGRYNFSKLILSNLYNSVHSEVQFDTPEVGELLIERMVLITVIDLIPDDSPKIHRAVLAISLCHRSWVRSRECVWPHLIYLGYCCWAKQTIPVQMVGM